MDRLEFPSERFIEDYVCEYLDAHNECPIDDESYDWFQRQVPIDAYGVIDVVKVRNRPGRFDIVILELKNEPLKESHVVQLARYMRGVERMASRYARRLGFRFTLAGQLAGPIPDSGREVVYLSGRLEDIDLYDVGIRMDEGFYSHWISDEWHRTNETRRAPKDVFYSLWDMHLPSDAGRVLRIHEEAG